VRGLEARLFGDICQGCLPTRYQVKVGDEDARGRCQLTRKHVATEEDCFLNSANLCRWVIEADDLQLDEQLGMGSYGIVYRARWKGINVAVKRFVRQKLDERLMLEFRAEVAILSELHHPNVVLFIGTHSENCSHTVRELRYGLQPHGRH
jgi:serine/threonine protein kinase